MHLTTCQAFEIISDSCFAALFSDPFSRRTRTQRMLHSQAQDYQQVRVGSHHTIQRLDWLKASLFGLTPSEITILKFIADIDGKTASYMREVVSTEVPPHSLSRTFLTIWNKEEFSNCEDMTRLLNACGVNLVDERKKRRGKRIRIFAKLAAKMRAALGRLVPRTAGALHLAWAASQKFMLSAAYEELARKTRNPILRVLSLRIAKQERRNFAWYFVGARAALTNLSKGRALVRLVFEKYWYPLSDSTSSMAEAQLLAEQLFRESCLDEAMHDLDRVMGELPGFESTGFAHRYSSQLAL